MQRTEAVVLAFYAAWLTMVLLAPFTLPPGSVRDLSGSVGPIDNPDQLARMNPFAALVYWIGDANCHQIASRSYYLNGNEMPFCARDLGIFVGLVAGMALGTITQIKPRWYLVMLGFLPMVLDGGWQLVGDYESTNEVRLLTGILAGTAASLLLHLLALRYGSKTPSGAKGGRDDLAERRPDS
jgi:uncharacterized membrane protein